MYHGRLNEGTFTDWLGSWDAWCRAFVNEKYHTEGQRLLFLLHDEAKQVVVRWSKRKGIAYANLTYADILIAFKDAEAEKAETKGRIAARLTTDRYVRSGDWDKWCEKVTRTADQLGGPPSAAEWETLKA